MKTQRGTELSFVWL